MSIYRSVDGQATLQDWCERRMATWPDHERRTFDSTLGSTHITITGTGPVAVLWLPGTNFNAATSANLARHLGTRFRTYIVDLPGQPGLSSSIQLRRNRIQRYGNWLSEVIAATGEPELLVAGHSLGAAIALAAEPHAAITNLALFSPAGLARVRITPKLLAVSTRWAIRPTHKRTDGLVRYMQDPASPVKPELTDWLTLVARHTKQSGAPRPLPAAQLDHWHRKTTIVAGEADRFFPPSKLAHTAHGSLGTTVRVVKKAGHLLPDEQPQTLLKLLTEVAALDS